MRLASLGSGSKGNATLIQCAQTTLLVDCGFSLTECEKRLQRLQLDVSAIDAILVTHEHSDHSSGVKRLASRHAIPVHTSVGTARALDIEAFTPLSGEQAFVIGDIHIRAVTVPHDAAEPVQFVFTDMGNQHRFGLLTDSGRITNHMKDAYRGLHGLLLEFNYDEDMLWNGPYPASLKQRISGGFGHLSNSQSLELLQAIDTRHLDCLIAAHLSEKNNTPEIVAGLLDQLAISASPQVACQQEGFDWVLL
jgi:phosphoribosyl 1,2-cyclic phosphodiesterase